MSIPRRQHCTAAIFLCIITVCSSNAQSCGSNLALADSSLTWTTVDYDRANQGYLFLTYSGTLLLDTQSSIPQRDTLSSFRNGTSSNSPGLYLPWGYIWYGGIFRLSFTMGVPASSSSLVVAILPAYDFDGSQNRDMSIKLDSRRSQQNASGSRSGSSSQMQMGSCTWPLYAAATTACVQISIEPGSGRNSVEAFLAYDPLGKRLSVSVGDAARNPEAPYAVATSMAFDLGEMLAGDRVRGQIGLFSTVGQLAQLQSWNMTVDRPLPKQGSQASVVVVLSSVLGSVAATLVAATAVYCYLNSKYRRWKKELDELAKTMQSLPGVPMHIDFADIKKATNNFDDATKLGRGGFGAVYGCTLPAAASRTGQAVKVAVKKFTRELQDQRYEDFLAEVSIINRLRHKNVVPLVGWSYNKGEPLLIYEYMKNGSLDQHLFPNNGGFGRGPDAGAIGQWDTRYGIARDIATGLHYLHHEHEPMVLHRDIKASNIMLDSTLCARLGDFGIACTVAADRSSITGMARTIGYIAPESIYRFRAARQTDVYAFGVLILEVVSGKKTSDVPEEDGHISLWARRLHREGKLLEALDGSMFVSSGKKDQLQPHIVEEARRLLLLGMACTSLNPSSRPSMRDVLQVINKLAPPPDVSLEKPTLPWLQPAGEWSSSSVSSEYGAAAMSNN